MCDRSCRQHPPVRTGSGCAGRSAALNGLFRRSLGSNLRRAGRPWARWAARPGPSLLGQAAAPGLRWTLRPEGGCAPLGCGHATGTRLAPRVARAVTASHASADAVDLIRFSITVAVSDWHVLTSRMSANPRCHLVTPPSLRVPLCRGRNWTLPQDHFYFKRRRYEVIDRIILGHKNFLITRRLSTESRRRYLAFDPVAGLHGAWRVLQMLPRCDETWQRIGVLQRLGQENPELPQIIEYHRVGDDIATVEPWIEGEDLRWWIRKMSGSPRQRLGTPEAIRLCRGLAHAVSHLHRRCNVVHADIKPANIILSSKSRRMTLIDFGSAWGIERTSRRKPGDGKSDQYAAPEIISDSKAVDFRADYFSLAAVCYELLTLQVPYDGLGGRAGAAQCRLEGGSLYVPPSALSREASRLDRLIWKSIDTLLERALQLDPQRRFLSSPEWLAAWDSVNDLIQRPPPQNPLDQLFLRVVDWFDQRAQRRP